MMARLTDEQWACVRADYEVRGMSFSELAEKYKVGKATISDKKKKDADNGDDWEKSKTEHLIQKKVSVIKALQETEQETERLKPNEIEAVNNEVMLRLAREKIFTDSALRNQELSNLTIEQSYNQGDLSIGELKAHSDITAKNKETVLGKQPDTAIQVNNNVSTISDKDEFRQVALEVLQMV